MAGVVSVATAVATVAVAFPAGAGAGEAARLVISERPPAFHGHLETGDFCTEGRRVRLFREHRGDRPDRVLGHDFTDSQGHWSVPIPGRSGAYYAKVAHLHLPSLGIRCAGDRSRTVVID
jgi:hypothetical protein